MATYWADYVNGNDANDGLSYAQAKKTWKAVLDTAKAAGAGNIVNIVAPLGGEMIIEDSDGATLSSLAGTDYDSAPGMRIRGTDNAGVEAHAYIQFEDTATSVTALSLSTGANMIDIQGLYVVWSLNSTACHSKHFCKVTSTSANGLRMRDCVYVWGQDTHGLILDMAGTISSDDCVFTHNVIFATDGVAAGGPVMCRFDPRGQVTHNHNIIIIGGAVASNVFPLDFGNNDANLTDHNISNNTIYILPSLVLTGTLGLIESNDHAPFSGTPVKTVVDNVLFWDASTAGRKWMGGESTADPANWAINIGYNQLHLGSGGSWASGYPYQNPWDGPGASGEWSGDNIVTADPFLDVGVPYEWFMSGSGYSIVLPYDLRINDPYRTTSSVGGVPGAIIDAITSPAPEINVDPTSLTINASILLGVTETVTIYNTGDSDLTISSATFVTASTTLVYNGAASYVIGAGDSQAVTFTFTPTTYPTTATGVLTILSDDADEPSVTVNVTGRTPTLFFPGGGLPATPVSADNPVIFNSPRAQDRGIKVGIHLRRNLDYAWNFTTTVGGFSDTVTNLKIGTVSIATNTGLSPIAGLTLSGYNKLMVMVEGGSSVLQVGEQTFLLRDGGCALLANVSNLNTILMSNPSTISNVDVHVFASGGVLTTSNPRGVRNPAQELEP